MSAVQLRVARPTNDLERVAAMYAAGLGLTRLGGFRAHAGFDGEMLGRPDLGWHLELTREAGAVAPRCPSPELLLVVYEPDPEAWASRCAAMAAAGFAEVEPHNPYWSGAGRTFEDPEGYRVVVQRGAWPPATRG